MNKYKVFFGLVLFALCVASVAFLVILQDRTAFTTKNPSFQHDVKIVAVDRPVNAETKNEDSWSYPAPMPKPSQVVKRIEKVPVIEKTYVCEISQQLEQGSGSVKRCEWK